MYNLAPGDVAFAINQNDCLVLPPSVKNNITVVPKNIDLQNPISEKELAVKTQSFIRIQGGKG
jgi:hypothetical protein